MLQVPVQLVAQVPQHDLAQPVRGDRLEDPQRSSRDGDREHDGTQRRHEPEVDAAGVREESVVENHPHHEGIDDAERRDHQHDSDDEGDAAAVLREQPGDPPPGEVLSFLRLVPAFSCRPVWSHAEAYAAISTPQRSKVAHSTA